MPVFLARRYGDVSAVERRDDEPVAFEWRGRRYAVRTVLDHWWETRAWWLDPGDGRGVADDEHEVWLVEAAARRSAVVVQLNFAWTTGRWTVDAVMD